MASRSLGSGATVLPGHVIARIEPRALRQLASKLPKGSVVVSGTNGKTTTARMVARASASAGLRPVHNRAGANLPAGITSAIAAQVDILGRLTGDIGIFEVDEAHLPSVLSALAPSTLVLTNVFRDQLDRYGEVDLIEEVWRNAVAAVSPTTTLVVNADDPIVAGLAEAAPGRVVTFGIDDPSLGTPVLPHDADRRLCRRCGAALQYTCSFYGHLGHFRCAACGWARKPPVVSLQPGEGIGDSPQRLAIRTWCGDLSLTLPLDGLYNVYNALAATATCLAIGINSEAISAAMLGFNAVFGRQERIAVGAGELTLTLVKNPVGFNQAIQTEIARRARTLKGNLESSPVEDPVTIIAINDRFADGRDISWLWDVDFERLGTIPSPDAAGTQDREQPRIVCTGDRAQDVALRLKYALVPANAIQAQPDEGRAVQIGIAAARRGARVALFASYTAMLGIRQRLERMHLVQPFWAD